MRVAEPREDSRWDFEKRLCEAWFHPGLNDEDRDWLRLHLALAGVEAPVVDVSWLTMERVR
jgi:hypothetical protein